MSTDVMTTASGESPTTPRSASARLVSWKRRLLVVAGLVLPLLAATALLVEFFRPVANAAGGCGGG